MALRRRRATPCSTFAKPPRPFHGTASLTRRPSSLGRSFSRLFYQCPIASRQATGLTTLPDGNHPLVVPARGFARRESDVASEPTLRVSSSPMVRLAIRFEEPDRCVPHRRATSFFRSTNMLTPSSHPLVQLVPAVDWEIREHARTRLWLAHSIRNHRRPLAG